MAITNTTIRDTFDAWRINTNQNSIDIGDLALLDPGLSSSDIVGALNNLASGVGAIDLLHVDGSLAWDSTPGDGHGAFIQWSDNDVFHIDAVAGVSNSSQIRFATHNASDAGVGQLRLVINENGNFGFGTSDIEAWDTTYTTLEFQESSIAVDTTGDFITINSNLYNDGSWKYKTTNPASQIVSSHSNGSISLRAMPSGTIDTIADIVNIANDVEIDFALTRFNRRNLDVDFQISSDTRPNAFYIDGATGVVGLNTNDIEAWNSSITAIEVETFASISGGGGSMQMMYNAYFDTAWKSKNTDKTTAFMLTSNDAFMRVLPSNTIDTNMDFALGNEIHMTLTDIILNEQGLDVNTIIESDTRPNAFYVNGADGNIGINTNDIEAWGSDKTVLESISSSIMFGTGNKEVEMISNAYQSGVNWSYKTTGLAHRIHAGDVSTSFLYAESGTIDTTVSWSTWMDFSTPLTGFGIRLNPSLADINIQFSSDTRTSAFYMDGATGNIGLNTNTPDGEFHIHTSTAGAISAIAGGNTLVLENSGAVGYSLLGSNTGFHGMYVGSSASGNDAGALLFQPSTDTWFIQSGNGTALGNFGSTLIAFNNSALDVDYRISSNNVTNTFYLNAGTDNIGLGTNAPNASALLHAVSTTKGVVLPVMTATQRDAIATPETGLIIYNSTDNRFSQNDSADNWDNLATISDAVSMAIALG